MQTRGLLVLLTAKAAGPALNAHDDDCREAMVGGIYPRSVCCAICDIKAFPIGKLQCSAYRFY